MSNLGITIVKDPKKMYKIILPKSARKELDNVDPQRYSTLRSRILELESNPRPAGCVKLTDKSWYRIRSGPYRILYEIDDDNKTVILYKIVRRKDAYRGL